MHAGHWITLSFILFASIIGTIVFLSIRQDISLVDEEYYEEELAYSQQMVRISNFNNLANKPTISNNDDQIHIQFPSELKYDKGTIHFYRPDKAKYDKKWTIEGHELDFYFKRKQFVSGKWKVKVEWEKDGKEYYGEYQLYI